MVVKVPTFRATKDISIQADILEELARFIGYGNITPELPRVTVRALEPDRMHQPPGPQPGDDVRGARLLRGAQLHLV